MRSISIFGCGWIGKALAHTLKDEFEINCLVKSTNSYKSLPFKNRFLLSPSNRLHHTFCNVDIIIVAIPPQKNYLNILAALCSYILPSTQLIFLSSTSVYTQTNGKVDETATDKISNPSLVLQAEYLLRTLKKDALILRLGGLMGYERIAGKYTQGQIKAYDTFVNYVYKDDVVNVIKLCIDKDLRDDTFNVVAPKHPKQSEVYRQNAKRFSFKNTYYQESKTYGKIVCSNKLTKELYYNFLRPDPLKFWC
jgi:nucleoside-diphosphate-sugar epimerase